jgi:hypothetical protein
MNSRTSLLALALLLLIVGVMLFVASNRITVQTVFPGRSPTGLSLQELMEVQSQHERLRLVAYASGGLAVFVILAAYQPHIHGGRDDGE